MMKDVLLSLPGIALTVVCWGAYGSVLHRGQHDLGNSRLKPLICVGLAYFVIAIILPVILLAVQGKLWDEWSVSGVSWGLLAGSAGAFGALGIILAMTAGGKPVYVMPLVFGCAPIVNVIVSMYFSNISWRNLNPVFIAGMILVSVGAVTVLVFQPKPSKTPPTAQSTPVTAEEPAAAVASKLTD